jgi:polysaccharide biosynthesis/export protein
MRTVIIILVSCILFFSCVTPRKRHYLQNPDSVIPSYTIVTTPLDYKVQLNDELNIRVMTLNPESSKIFNPHSYTMSSTTGGVFSNVNVKGLYTYTVYDDGTIDFPYIGSVLVEGKTTREIKSIIENQLVEFVKDCSVEVRLVNSYVNILTNTTGKRIPLTTEKMNIFEVLSIAGDVGPYSKRSDVKIIRQTPDGTIIKSFDLRSKDILHSDFYFIQPNDVIYVTDFDGQFFRINSFVKAITTTAATVSFTVFIWKFVEMWIPKK